MHIMKKWRTGIWVFVLALVCMSANAQCGYRHYRPYRTVPVAVRYDVISHVCNRFTQKERLMLAMAYLEKHKCLTINRYAKMTHLGKSSAEAELDAFAMDKENPIRLVVKGKKKVYIKE